MSYYRTCPHCGANLDPGERCNCLEAQQKAPVSAANADRGDGNKIEQCVSTSHDNREVEDLQE